MKVRFFAAHPTQKFAPCNSPDMHLNIECHPNYIIFRCKIIQHYYKRSFSFLWHDLRLNVKSDKLNNEEEEY
jgi:hypothetical protein